MKKRILVVLGVALGAVLAMAGYSLGATTVPKVTACATTAHVLRHIYATNASCPSGQRRIQWNQKGPAGPAGPAGPGAQYNAPSAIALLGNGVSSVTAKCPATDPHVISGGYSFGPTTSGGSTTVYPVVQDGPVGIGPASGFNAWTVAVQLPSELPSVQTNTTLTVSIVCSK